MFVYCCLFIGCLLFVLNGGFIMVVDLSFRLCLIRVVVLLLCVDCFALLACDLGSVVCLLFGCLLVVWFWLDCFLFGDCCCFCWFVVAVAVFGDYWFIGDVDSYCWCWFACLLFWFYVCGCVGCLHFLVFLLVFIYLLLVVLFVYAFAYFVNSVGMTLGILWFFYFVLIV